jgi:hypothetical protein
MRLSDRVWWVLIGFGLGLTALAVTSCGAVQTPSFDPPGGCKRTLPLSVGFVRGAEDLRPAFQHAAKEWRKAYGAELFRFAAPQETPTVLVAYAPVTCASVRNLAECVHRIETWLASTVTLCEERTPRIVIRWHKGNGRSYVARALATHELGHALGLDHNASDHSIMYPYLDTEPHSGDGSPRQATAQILQADVLTLRKLYAP